MNQEQLVLICDTIKLLRPDYQTDISIGAPLLEIAKNIGYLSTSIDAIATALDRIADTMQES